MGPTLYWTKVAALGQVAGAVATFGAVVISLYLSRTATRPRLRLKVGERLFLGGGMPERRVLVFSIINGGERPVHVRTLGWQTGWTRWGPSSLKRQYAVQIFGAMREGVDPPYEIQPGQEVSAYLDRDQFFQNVAGDKVLFWARRWPILGIRRTAVWGTAFTADGHVVRSRIESSFADALIAAVRAGSTATS